MHAITNKFNPFKQSAAIWVVELLIPYKHVESFTMQLEDLASSISCFEADDTLTIDPRPDDIWKLTMYCEVKPDAGELDTRIRLLAASCNISSPAYHMEVMEDHDWVGEVQKNFPPLSAGRFFIYGQHYEGTLPTSATRLKIDAGRAFGTGEHETTSTCLEALSHLAKRRRFSHMLDMGCGTGILAIAMAKTWHAPVIAVDIDDQAVRITAENAAVNRVADTITAQVSDGYKSALVPQHAPYDLITSNILARPLVRFAPALAKSLAPGGIAILSGLLTTQEHMVLSAHRAQGLRLVKRFRRNGWSTLVVGK